MTTIETERLLLRQPVADDLDAYAAMWTNTDMLADVPIDPQSRALSSGRLMRVAGCWVLTGYGQWLVFDRVSGDLVGQVGFFDAYRDFGADFDQWHEASWMFLPTHWGQGFATEAVQAAHAWMDLQSFGARTSCMMGANQIASINVAEKCGYTLLRKKMIGDVKVHLMTRQKPDAT